MFTTWSKEAKFDPHLTISNSPIPVKSKVKVIGVTIDCMLNLGEHVIITKEKLQKRNNMLKKNGGCVWGCAKETVSVTHNVFGRSVLNYGASIWTSTISNTNWNHLQTQQNMALGTLTGFVKKSLTSMTYTIRMK